MTCSRGAAPGNTSTPEKRSGKGAENGSSAPDRFERWFLADLAGAGDGDAEQPSRISLTADASNKIRCVGVVRYRNFEVVKHN